MSEKVVKLENNFNQVIERKIAVIFVTDVVGFSKLMEINEDETLKSFRVCRDILDKLFSEHGGRVFNTAGDSVLAEFQSAVSAVICANEFQKLLKERNNSVSDDAKMNFRIGLNMGDVIVEGDNLYGDQWISKVAGAIKTKEEAQAIVTGKIEEAQAAYDALSDEEKARSSRPVVYNLP